MDTWLQIEISTTQAGLEPLCAALEEIDISGLVIQDPRDFEEFLQGKRGKWDLVDESLMHLRKANTSVTFYLPRDESVQARLAQVDQALDRLRALDVAGQFGPLDECIITDVAEESWQDSWKKHWKPTRVGQSLIVCPSWEEYAASPGQTIIRLDPGMAFGTGTHDSTRLCMELAERAVRPGARVLDLGCGSGILAITALLLGADSALGIDIDPVAVRVCAENAALNGVQQRAAFRVGSLAQGVPEQYDLIFANIIADVILQLIPDLPRLLSPGGAFITSGILSERAGEIQAALTGVGLRLSAKLESGGWAALELKMER